MKPEDVTRAWNAACEASRADPLDFRAQLEFASAIESHVRAETLAMCKEKAFARANYECTACGGEGYDEDSDDDADCSRCGGSCATLEPVPIDWSAVDAAVEELP